MKIYLVVNDYYGVATPIAVTLDKKLAEKYAENRFYVVSVDFNEGVFCHFGEDDLHIDLNYLDAEDI